MDKLFIGNGAYQLFLVEKISRIDGYGSFCSFIMHTKPSSSVFYFKVMELVYC